LRWARVDPDAGDAVEAEIEMVCAWRPTMTAPYALLRSVAVASVPPMRPVAIGAVVSAPTVSALRADTSPGFAEGGQAPAAWLDIAHEPQLAPEGAWRMWLLMGGRGAGKTRAGAEWVRGLVESGIAKRIALVGPSLHDVREVMIAGPSGLCAIGDPAVRPTYEVTRRRLVWPPVGNCKDAVAYTFSAEDPDSLRGPQFDLAWCDEIGAWANDLRTWNTLAFGMRLGPAPRIVATTTPRPRSLVKILAEKAERNRGGVVITRAATRANAANLSPDFVAGLEEDYAGTELGRQELDGELGRRAVVACDDRVSTGRRGRGGWAGARGGGG
jgi:phage terminase large subunit-like protein